MYSPRLAAPFWNLSIACSWIQVHNQIVHEIAARGTELAHLCVRVLALFLPACVCAHDILLLVILIATVAAVADAVINL